MKQAVRDAFVPFTSKFEGVVKWMYADIKGLVTVGIGNLIDPCNAYVLSMPFVHASDGRPATAAEISADWQRVKNDPNAAHDGYRETAHETALRLTDDGVSRIVLGRLDLNDSLLRVRFADWATWPADAQLATHSMAWACGPAFDFPRLVAALRRGDFAAAAGLCHIDDSRNAGVTPRNAANVALYRNAARVVAEGLDPEALLYGAPPPPFIEGGIVHPDPLDVA